jgi:hypothetical protein
MPSLRWTCGDHTLTLADGRTLGYAIYGDPAGLPVVNCHGGLVRRMSRFLLKFSGGHSVFRLLPDRTLWLYQRLA